jgi:DNA-binding CsgD family transcriptional regulator
MDNLTTIILFTVGVIHLFIWFGRRKNPNERYVFYFSLFIMGLSLFCHINDNDVLFKGQLKIISIMFVFYNAISFFSLLLSFQKKLNYILILICEGFLFTGLIISFLTFIIDHDQYKKHFLLLVYIIMTIGILIPFVVQISSFIKKYVLERKINVVIIECILLFVLFNVKVFMNDIFNKPGYNILLNTGLILTSFLFSFNLIRKINIEYNELNDLKTVLEHKNKELEEHKNKLEQKLFIKVFESYCTERKIKNDEFDILSKVINGVLYKEIAIDYAVSESTIKRKIKEIFNKLEINNKEELVMKIKEL